MKKLNVTVENFSVIREELKAGGKVLVNDKIPLVHYVANTERISENGKKVRTPFYYVAENGIKYTSTTLKQLLGLELETKGERKQTTFATVWVQAQSLAKVASTEELQEAVKHLQSILKERKEEEKAKAEKERKRKEALAKLSDEEKALLGL